MPKKRYLRPEPKPEPPRPRRWMRNPTSDYAGGHWEVLPGEDDMCCTPCDEFGCVEAEKP